MPDYIKVETNLLVSVIIPVYNVRPYLRESLDSVLCLNYDHLEIIIIDDGSTDGSGEICDEYAAKDARVIILHQEHKGLSSARNAGLDRMTGDLVSFLDPDDTYEPEYIGEMLFVLLRENADIVICQSKIKNPPMFRRQNKIVKITEGLYGRENALRALVDGSIGPAVWDKLYRKKLWDTIRFPDGHVYEDVETTCRILLSCSFVYILNKQLYQYRLRAGSITSTHTVKNKKDLILAKTHFVSFVKANTPEIFTAEQLRGRQQKLLNNMFRTFITFYGSQGREEKEFCENLKKQIFAFGKDPGIEKFDFRTKAAYYMLRTWPRFMKVIFSVYYPFNMLIKMLTGQL